MTRNDRTGSTIFYPDGRVVDVPSTMHDNELALALHLAMMRAGCVVVTTIVWPDNYVSRTRPNPDDRSFKFGLGENLILG